MKTTWVLTEEERKQKFEGRKKKRKSGSIDEEIVDDPLARVGISSQELEEVSSSMVRSVLWGPSTELQGGTVRANKRALGRE